MTSFSALFYAYPAPYPEGTRSTCRCEEAVFKPWLVKSCPKMFSKIQGAREVLKEAARATSTVVFCLTPVSPPSGPCRFAEPKNACKDKTSYSVCKLLRSHCGKKTVQEACCKTCQSTPTHSPSSPSQPCADARVGPLAGLPCAKLKPYCTNAMFKKNMAKSCPATCGHCCVDKPASGLGSTSCAQVKSVCTTPMFRATLRKSCPWLQ